MALIQKNTALVINTMMAPWISDLFDNQLLATNLGIVNPAGDITGKNGDTVKTPQRGSLTARTKSAGSDFVFDAADSSLNTFGTITQPYRAFTLETTAFQLIENGKTELLQGFLQDAIYGLAEDIDGLFLATYSSLSASESGSVIDDALINTVAYDLDNAKVGRMDRHFIVGPHEWNNDLMNATTNSLYNRADGIGSPASQTVTSGTLGSIRGFQFHMSPLIKTTAGSPDTHHCIAFKKGCLGTQFVRLYDNNDLPGATVIRQDYKGAQIRVAFSYDFNADKYKVRVDTALACGVLWDALGVAVNVTV